ncbi:unnamed protein product [Closterium sp. Naga37s-1]|nr:unnamed protein product [Closterium sp. Naga37s-1]
MLPVLGETRDSLAAMLPFACAPQFSASVVQFDASSHPPAPSPCARAFLANGIRPSMAPPAPAIAFTTTSSGDNPHPPQSEFPPDSSDSIEVQLPAASTPFHCDPPPPLVRTTPRELLRLFRDMTVIRRAEIVSDLLFKERAVRGFCHLYDGQEAVAVGMEAAMAPHDALITAYRDHGFFLSRGGSLQELFAELMGRRDGCAHGKGGSMHLYGVARGFYGGWGIVGTSPPLGAGLALGQKLAGRQGGGVTAAVYGDGAANQGQVYEAMNMAALWRLPVVFVVENNHYGMGTSERRASAQTSFFDRVNYIPGLLDPYLSGPYCPCMHACMSVQVDGMDVLAVKQAMEYAKQHAIAKGPMVLEMDTYRYHGHSMSDPGSSYRQRTEIQQTRRARDPIERVRRLILEHKVESEEGLRQADKRVRAEVDAAVKAARDAAAPRDEELWQRVYKLDKGMVFTAPVVSGQRVEMP